MEKEFVTYEIALKLKELGFDEISRFGHETSLYNNKGYHVFYSNYGLYTSGLGEGYIYAPLWQQVIEWLRNVHHLHITITSMSQESWQWHLQLPHETLNVRWAEDYYTYEDAREAAILKAIELCWKEKR